MTSVALVCLNTGGTKGHEVPMRSLADALKLRGHEVWYCTRSLDSDLQLPQ